MVNFSGSPTIKNGRVIVRQDPLFTVSDQTRAWFYTRYQARTHRRLKSVCLVTGRGRSYNRLTSLNRSQFLARLRTNQVWALQKSSW